MVPAATFRLIQEDAQPAQDLTFDDAFALMVRTESLGDLLHPDPELPYPGEPTVEEIAVVIMGSDGGVSEAGSK